MSYTLLITDDCDDLLRQKVIKPLKQFNENKVGPGGHRRLAVVLKDDSEGIIGGIWGGTSYDWLFIELIFVPEGMREMGIGSKMMKTAEKEAIGRGCHSSFLDTFEFQSKPFYEKLGYEVFGKLQDFPVGYCRYFMKKVLLF